MWKFLEGIGEFHARLIEWYVVAYFSEGRREAAEAIVRAYRSEHGQEILWANGSPQVGQGAPWRALWELGILMEAS